MPNQSNFRSDITTPREPRLLASRIVQIPTETVLLEEVPASFGYDGEDNIEFHFYATPGNILLVSTTARLSDNIIKSHIVSYGDGTFKTYLQIDLTALFVLRELVLIPGEYKVVINFFSDEIGSYEDRRLTITTISPSRTEVELQFNNEITPENLVENEQLYNEFIKPSFIRADAIGLVQKIFQSGVETGDNTEGILASNLFNNITIPEVNLRQRPEDTLDRISRINQFDNLTVAINDFLPTLVALIQEQIALYGDDRIQVDELMPLIEDAVLQQLGELQNRVDNRIQIS
jgi:hypothetical protein